MQCCIIYLLSSGLCSLFGAKRASDTTPPLVFYKVCSLIAGPAFVYLPYVALSRGGAFYAGMSWQFCFPVSKRIQCKCSQSKCSLSVVSPSVVSASALSLSLVSAGPVTVQSKHSRFTQCLTYCLLLSLLRALLHFVRFEPTTRATPLVWLSLASTLCGPASTAVASPSW
jgi:hypothetical protein